jgi:ABC-type dipeptide/oligopeptide/nickel transport system permease component
MRILPGDPARLVAGENATPEVIENIRHKLGLDLPLFDQYVTFIRKIITGDFGESFYTHMPVMYEIGYAYSVTIELTILAWISGTLFGILFGILLAIKRNTIIDHVFNSLTFGIFSLPQFWVGMLLQLFFSVALGILPVSGMYEYAGSKITGLQLIDAILTLNFVAFIGALKHLILPAITLALWIFPSVCTMTRASLIEELDQPYIATARAKGVTERSIVMKHAFRNVLLPVSTVIGLRLTALLGGTVLIETIFGLPGLGRLLFSAMSGRDLPLIQACVAVFAALTLIINTVGDILYKFIDPRVEF